MSPIICVFLLIIMLSIFWLYLNNLSNISLSFIDNQLWLFYTKKSMDGMLTGFYKDQKFAKLLIDLNEPKKDPY